MHESPVDDTARVASIFLFTLLDLEEVVMDVFNLPVSISLVIDKLPLV